MQIDSMSTCGMYSSSMDSDQLYLHDDLQDHPEDHSGTSSKAEIRKSNKPIMEKRRRARINNCLNDLKGILLEAMRKDPARHSKLEKADILELTVRHLQNIQRNQLAVAMATDPTVLYRFKNGFSECASEVSRYLSKMDGVDTGMKSRVSVHLTGCVNGLQQVSPPTVPVPGGYPTAVGIGGARYSLPGGVVDMPPFTPPSQLTPPVFSPPCIPTSNLTPPSSGEINNNSNSRIQQQQQEIAASQESPHGTTRSIGTSAFSLIPKPEGDSSSKSVSSSRSLSDGPPGKRRLAEDTSNPLDYSLGKVRLHNHQQQAHVTSSTDDNSSTPRPVRMVKVEPIHLSLSPDGGTPTSAPKDSMWRPW